MVTDLIDAMRQEMTVKLASLEGRIATLLIESQPPPQNWQELANNFVVYRLMEVADGVEENAALRVKTLLSGELKLENVYVTSAEQKPKFNNNDCGVIVAKCVDFTDKQKVMEAKSKLRESEHFSHIRIFHDKPKWQRQHEENLRLVVKTFGTNKLYVTNSPLTEERENDWQNQNGRGQARGRGRRRDCGRGAGQGRARGQGRNQRPRQV